MFRFLSFLFLSFFCASFVTAQTSVSIIPKPVELKVTAGKSVSINDKTILYYPAKFETQALYLKEQIQKQTGIILKTQKFDDPWKKPLKGILMQVEPVKIVKYEMYNLFVEANEVSNRVVIKANDIRGFINAFQTLLHQTTIIHQHSCCFNC
jgi:Glycosyl hydrolase family 20, domain 2